MRLLLNESLRLPNARIIRRAFNADGSMASGAGHATLAVVNGPRVYVLLSAPLLASGLRALRWPPRLLRPGAMVGAAIAAAFVGIGLASVGLFFVPSAAALIALAVARQPSSRPAA
jgi:hypothetical protein